MTTTAPASLELHDWREERKIRELAFYRAAFTAGELVVLPGKEHTVRRCKCDICLEPQEAGISKFWYRGKGGGFWWVRLCEECLAELSNSVNVPIVSQISQPATG